MGDVQQRRLCGPKPEKPQGFEIVRVLKVIPLDDDEDTLDDIIERNDLEDGDHREKDSEEKEQEEEEDGVETEEEPLEVMKENEKSIVIKREVEDNEKEDDSVVKTGNGKKLARHVLEWKFSWLPVSCISEDVLNHFSCVIVMGPVNTLSNRNMPRTSMNYFMYWVKIELVGNRECHRFDVMTHGELVAKYPHEFLRYLASSVEFVDKRPKAKKSRKAEAKADKIRKNRKKKQAGSDIPSDAVGSLGKGNQVTVKKGPRLCTAKMKRLQIMESLCEEDENEMEDEEDEVEKITEEDETEPEEVEDEEVVEEISDDEEVEEILDEEEVEEIFEEEEVEEIFDEEEVVEILDEEEVEEIYDEEVVVEILDEDETETEEAEDEEDGEVVMMEEDEEESDNDEYELDEMEELDCEKNGSEEHVKNVIRKQKHNRKKSQESDAGSMKIRKKKSRME